jgi:rhodanese-related sulfurtransferase
MRKTRIAAVLALVLLAGCRTVGMSHEKGGYADVHAPIAQEMLLDNRKIVVFDVRPTAEYDGPLGHIAGAYSLPLDSIESHLTEILPYQGNTVMVYGDAEEESIRGSRLLVAAGFQNVVRISGGIRKWLDLGYHTVASQ